MKTFLVPIDFSDTSRNAAVYAVQLAAGVEDAKIILLNVFDEILAGVDGTPLYNDIDARKKIAIFGLETLRNTLSPSDNITIDCDAEPGTLVHNIGDYTKRNNADLIVMGITGSSALDQVMIGSTTLHVVHNVDTPVMIIPPDATYKGVSNIAITSDLKDVAKTTPFAALQSLLTLLKGKLHIVHVDEDNSSEQSEGFATERAVFEQNLASLHPGFSNIKAGNFLEGLDKYVAENNIDALVTIPKKHTFLENLFRTRHTKKLAYHMHIPIIAIHL